MATNQELVDQLKSDLGVALAPGRRPTAKMIFKWMDIDLLPHSSTGTLLGEVFDWSGRNWRTTELNLIPKIFSQPQSLDIIESISNVTKEEANVPDFEFTKEDLVDFGLAIPSLFDIKLNGDIRNAKELCVKVNGVKKSRITNTSSPGNQIIQELLNLSNTNSELYKNIKNDYISIALFYADSVEIYLTKDTGVDVDVEFAIENVTVEANANTETKKNIKLKYTGAVAPFGADIIKIKNWDLI